MPLLSPVQRLVIAIGVPTVALLLFLWYRRRQRAEVLDDEEDEDEEETSKVSTVFETRIEVKVPQNLVGSVIGRGGETIKQIQKESGAYVRFKDDEKEKEDIRDGFDASPPPEDEKTRTVVIKGEREKAKKAEIMIKKIISDQPKVFTVDYFIPQNSCGRVIGRGGATIRHLSRVSGAKITIDRSEIRIDEPRLCTIKGTSDQIANAKGLIDEQVAEHELAMARKPLKQRQVNVPPIRAHQASNISDEAPSSSQYPNTSDYVEVFISAVDNPGHFWVQLVRTGDAQKLDTLINALTDEAVKGNENDTVDAVEVGMVCSAPFSHDDSRYRAKVTQINDDGTVGLFYVDYGDFETVPKYRLRKLKEEHLQLPFQAIECYLANTKPKDGVWDEHATEEFKELTHYPDWKVVVVKAVKYCGDIPCLDVYDTSTPQDIWINDEMVKRGFAVEDQSYPPQPSKPNENRPKEKRDLSDIKKDSTNSSSNEMPSATEVILSQDALPPDEKDAGEDLDLNISGPVSPQKFSPIKNALVKRVSKDYIETSPKQESNRASIGVISEEKNSEGHIRAVMEEPQLYVEVESQAESAPEVKSIREVESAPEVESTTEVVGTYESESNSFPSLDMNQMTGSESQPEVSGKQQPKTKVSNFHSPKKNTSQVLKPEVQEMIQIEVSQAFETQLTPSRQIVTQSTLRNAAKSRDGVTKMEKIDVTDSGIGLDVQNGKEVKHVETTLNVNVGSPAQPSVIVVDSKGKDDANDDDDDDDDLETFTTTFQKQVQAKKTFVSSVTVTSSKQAAVTLVPSSEKNESVTEVSHQTQKSYAKVVRSSKEMSKEDPEFLKHSIALNLGEAKKDEETSHNYGNVFTVQQIEIEAKSDGGFVLGPDRHSITNETNQSAGFKSIATLGQKSTQTGQTSSYTRTTTVAIGAKDENGKGGKVERRSPDSIDSDSESYVSALDEPASDTDTTSNYETAAGPTSGSSTSLNYVTAENDTDTDTVRSPGEEGGTPVNSDSDDDDDDDEYYDTDDEDDSDGGDKTPKRKTSEGKDDEEGTPTSGSSIKMAAKYLSDLDLGYRGDAEDTTGSREDLR